MFGSAGSMPMRLFNSGNKQATAEDLESSQSEAKSNFKSALDHVAVPPVFFEGIKLFKVSPPKGKLEPCTIVLSRDKFVLSVQPRVQEQRQDSNGGRSSPLKRPSILTRRNRSGASVDSSYSNGGSVDTGSVTSYSSISTSSVHMAVDIGSIDRISSGQNTLLFEKAKQREKRQSIRNMNGVPLMEEKRCFSLLFRGAKSLDLMVDDSGDREQFLFVMDNLVSEYNKAKSKVGNEVLLLRYIWNDVDRDNSNTINEKEMVDLLNRINFEIREKNHVAVYTKVRCPDSSMSSSLRGD